MQENKVADPKHKIQTKKMKQTTKNISHSVFDKRHYLHTHKHTDKRINTVRILIRESEMTTEIT